MQLCMHGFSIQSDALKLYANATAVTWRANVAYVNNKHKNNTIHVYPEYNNNTEIMQQYYKQVRVDRPKTPVCCPYTILRTVHQPAHHTPVCSPYTSLLSVPQSAALHAQLRSPYNILLSIHQSALRKTRLLSIHQSALCTPVCCSPYTSLLLSIHQSAALTATAQLGTPQNTTHRRPQRTTEQHTNIADHINGGLSIA